MVKKCFKCGKKKNINEFYKHPQMADGYFGKCKECANSYQCQWEKDNYEKVRIRKHNYQKTYYKMWYAKNGRKRKKDYNKIIEKWQKDNAEKVVVQRKMRHAVKMKIISKPTICSNCGDERKILAHHEDYSKPLEVVWLCYSCHKKTHLTNSTIKF